MREVTNKVMGNLQLDEEYELMSMLAKKQTRLFTVNNIKDLLNNYDFLSSGQYNPNWIDLSSYLKKDKDLLKAYNRKLEFASIGKELYKQIPGEFKRETQRAYDSNCRTIPPENINVEKPKIINLERVTMNLLPKINLPEV